MNRLWIGNRFPLLAAALLSAGMVNVSTAAVLIDFESDADISNNFVSTSATLASTTNTPTIGTASLRNTADATATYKNAAYALPVGKQITLSMKFSKAAATSVNAPLLQLGLTNTSGNGFGNGTSAAAVYSRVVPTTTGNTGVFDFVYNSKTTAATNASQLTGQSGFMIDGSSNPWYLLSVTIQRTDTNTFNQLGSLQRLAADNVTPTTLIASFTGNAQTNADVASAADAGTLLAGFRCASQTFGALRLDTFAVSDVSNVPEPTVLGAAAVVGGLLLRRRR